MDFPQKLDACIHSLSKLPGLGQKSALRHVLNMTNWVDADLRELGESILDLQNLKECTVCGMFCDDKLCDVCGDQRRSQSKTICVVENISDCLAIEKSEQFGEKYHILGGVLNPLMGIGPGQLNLDSLFSRIKGEGIESVILALNPSVEGDATCSYIKGLISHEVSVERIGFGIPIGGNLEYLDALTISKALENRQQI